MRINKMCRSKLEGGRRCPSNTPHNRRTPKTRPLTLTGATAHISTIAPIEQFDQAVKDGHIYARQHPTLPYTLYKYLPVTQYSRNWNPVTENSRGLIINHETGEIVARPFRKFFNYGELENPETIMVGTPRVYDKLDGSLGISYLTPEGKFLLSSGGGFTSVQADKANEMYQTKYENNWEPNPDYTYLFEIIYPENRIVLYYGEREELVLLSAIEKATGKTIPASDVKEWKWSKPEEYDYTTLPELLNTERPNREGYILYYPQTDARVKIKHAEYVEHHRVMTGVNERMIVEQLSQPSGRDQLEAWRMLVPEEFKDYIDNTINKYEKLYQKEEQNTQNHYEQYQKRATPDITPKDRALLIKEIAGNNTTLFSELMSLAKDGKLSEKQHQRRWQNLKPPADGSTFWSKTSGQTNPE